MIGRKVESWWTCYKDGERLCGREKDCKYHFNALRKNDCRSGGLLRGINPTPVRQRCTTFELSNEGEEVLEKS